MRSRYNTSSDISIAIPAYDMHGVGGKFLDFSLEKIISQTCKNYEVVIADHSLDSQHDVRNICYKWKTLGMNIVYLRNKKDLGNSSANINLAINSASSDIIKILFQDDFLYNNFALERTINTFTKSTASWLISACSHTCDGFSFYNNHYPRYHDDIHLGYNTISSPSVLSIKKHVKERFDTNLIWLMDVEFYKRLYTKYNMPEILQEITVVNRTWDKQLSNVISLTTKDKELNYVKHKYRY